MRPKRTIGVPLASIPRNSDVTKPGQVKAGSGSGHAAHENPEILVKMVADTCLSPGQPLAT